MCWLTSAPQPHLILRQAPELFSRDIARMVNLKHELLIEELVID